MAPSGSVTVYFSRAFDSTGKRGGNIRLARWLQTEGNPRRLTFVANGKIVGIVDGEVFPPITGVRGEEIKDGRVTEDGHVPATLRALRRHLKAEGKDTSESDAKVGFIARR